MQLLTVKIDKPEANPDRRILFENQNPFCL